MSFQKNPKISIITVLKDDDVGILKTANSLLRQKDSSYEWIIVDGSISSFAKSLIAADPYRNLNCNYIWEEPKGIYQAMNVGWKAAKGEFILFLNAGDFFASTISFSVLITNLIPDVDLVAYPVIHVNSDNIIYAISVPEILHVDQFKRYAIMNHQGVVLKRSLLEFLGGFDESMRFASDGKLLDAALAFSRIMIRKEILVAFTFGGASSENHKKVWKEIGTYREITFSPFEIWRMGFKTKLRGFLFHTFSNNHFKKTVNLLITRRMQHLLANYKDQIEKLDLL